MVAAVIGVPLLRLRGHYLAFATLAFNLICVSLLYAQDRFTGGQYGIAVTKPLEIGGHAISGATHAAVVWGLVAVALLLSANLVRSRSGRALQAIAADEPSAAAPGSTLPRSSCASSSSPRAGRPRRRALHLLASSSRTRTFRSSSASSSS